MKEATVPMVIDADGLNAFAGKTELLKTAAQGRAIVLTQRARRPLPRG